MTFRRPTWRAGLVPAATRSPGRRVRGGMTLLEVMIAVAIIVMVTVVLLPTIDGAFQLQQRQSARQLASLYEQLHDEAILRNKTFRVVYNLTDNALHVEVGNAGATAFDTPEAREEAEERARDNLKKLSPEELAQIKEDKAFQAVSGEEYGAKMELPGNTRFGSIYTPEYEQPVTADGIKGRHRRRVKDDEKGPVVVASHVFANGFAEYTVVQIVDKDDPKEGYTVVVDPLSGKVTLHDELIDERDAWRWLPDKGPSLNL